MKKNILTFVNVLMAVSAAAALMLSVNSCKDDNDDEDEVVPTITWEKNPTFATTELAAKMDVELELEAKDRIKGLTIKVESPTATFIGLLNGMVTIAGNKSETAPVLDLINDPGISTTLAAFGVPTGSSLSGKTDVDFSLSTLVPMIMTMSPAANTNHVFTATLTDATGDTCVKKITFHYTGK